MRVGLYIAGSLVQCFGIILLAYPDLLPAALRLAAWLRRRVRRVVNALRSFVGRPPLRAISMHAEAGELRLDGSLRAVRGVSPEAADARKIAFLLEEAERTQGRLSEVEERLTALERDLLGKLHELRETLVAHFGDALAEADADYRAVRLWGAAFLLLGLGLSTGGVFAH